MHIAFHIVRKKNNICRAGDHVKNKNTHSQGHEVRKKKIVIIHWCPRYFLGKSPKKSFFSSICKLCNSFHPSLSIFKIGNIVWILFSKWLFMFSSLFLVNPEKIELYAKKRKKHQTVLAKLQFYKDRKQFYAKIWEKTRISSQKIVSKLKISKNDVKSW